MTVRGGGIPRRPLALTPNGRMGPPLRSFAADAHDCIMVRVLGPTGYKVVARLNRVPKAGSPLIVIATALSVPSCSKPSRYGLARAKHAARLVRRPILTASARIDQRCAGRDEETDFEIKSRNRRRKKMRGPGKFLDKESAIQGLFARFGRQAVEACFQAILDKCRDIYRNELLPKIADGEYSWEDYGEHDGVSDPKLHKLALKMIKRGGRITLDFTGTDPQSSGPINWPADYAGGAFLIKWIAPILRNLADTPERAAEIHVNEGVCEVFDIVFPPKGTLITPEWPAATNARSFVLLRCLGLLAGVVAPAVGGRMPADQETIRYTGFFGTDADGKPFLSREVLGGGSGGRYYADGSDAIHIVPDSRNQPAEFTETRFPLLVEKLALRMDSGGAGKRRGGLGDEKHYRALVDCRTIVTADRVRLGCYGVNGGAAGRPFCVTGDLQGAPRDLGGLVAGEPRPAGQGGRAGPTGGGGWGDPLERESELVARDVTEGRVSQQAARDDYGVVGEDRKSVV